MQQQQRQRMGDLLRRLVPLSWQDVNEILQEQRIGTRRFGETAIALGLCQPEHVWQAWSGQHSEEADEVDLDEIGIDAQAVALIPREIAMRYCAIPVRVVEDRLIVAVSEATFPEAAEHLPRSIERKIKFVIAPDHQIHAGIERYYPL